jgi:uncharacterized membrane protein YfcA
MDLFSSPLWSLSGRAKYESTNVHLSCGIGYVSLCKPVYQQTRHHCCRSCCFQAAPASGSIGRWFKKKDKLFTRRTCAKQVGWISCRMYSTSSASRLPVPSKKQTGENNQEKNSSQEEEEEAFDSEKHTSTLQVTEKSRTRRTERSFPQEVSSTYVPYKPHSFLEEDKDNESTDLFKELRNWLVEGPDTAFKFSLSSAIFVFIVSVLLQKVLPHSSHDLIGLETMDTMFPSKEVTEQLSFWEQLSRVFRGPYILVSLILGFASFTQAFAGFGFAVVAVGILSQFGWIVNSNVFQDIQPVAAVIGSLIGWTLVGTQWNKVEWKEIMPLLISCMISTPLGAWGLQYVNHSVSLHILGSLIFGFVIYSFSGLQPPRKWFANKIAAWTLGGLAGIFGGAFDINGPPLVFYGQAKQWQPEEFKRNILAVISLNSSFVVLFDALCGRLNDYYIGPFLLYSLPFVITGTYGGVLLSKKLGPKRFKQAVLATCFLMSLRLLTS